MRARLRRARSGACLSALVVVAAMLVAPGMGPASGGAAPSPFAGTGMWVWYLSDSGGTPQGLARAADRHGIGTVFVKSGDGSNYWGQFTTSLVDALHERGITACAWQFVYGSDPAKEARIGARAVERGADCLVIDAESQYEGHYAAADAYVRKLRRAVGKGYPIGLAGFPYVDYHPAYPYSVFLGRGGAQFNVPQMYWKTIGVSVRRIFSHTYRYNAAYDRPIAPLGQTYANPPNSGIRDFRRYARAYRADGLSWWSWNETEADEWRALTKRLGGGGAPIEPRTDPVTLARGDAGDLVVQAQELLLAYELDLKVSGVFGGSTERAVGELQEQAGLKITGRIGDRTWAKLLERRPVRVHWSRSAHGRGTGTAWPASASLPSRGREIPPPPAR